eukprot:3074257-Alexandrium_andersonii.AAC.1
MHNIQKVACGYLGQSATSHRALLPLTHQGVICITCQDQVRVAWTPFAPNKTSPNHGVHQVKSDQATPPVR